MVKSGGSVGSIKLFATEHGLSVLGALELKEEHCAEDHRHLKGCPALLIGNTGPDMWQFFCKSAEFGDGAKDPMNRWTRRVTRPLESAFDCKIFHPFDEPYWPFQRIARAAIGIKSSPLGILIHPEFGLWHALRAILVFENSHELASQISRLQLSAEGLIHPCDSCEEKPCLTACPVGAFSGRDLSVVKCFSHIDSGLQPECMDTGCQARSACPVGVEHRYDANQIRFHMNSYRGP